MVGGLAWPAGAGETAQMRGPNPLDTLPFDTPNTFGADHASSASFGYGFPTATDTNVAAPWVHFSNPSGIASAQDDLLGSPLFSPTTNSTPPPDFTAQPDDVDSKQVPFYSLNPNFRWSAASASFSPSPPSPSAPDRVTVSDHDLNGMHAWIFPTSSQEPEHSISATYLDQQFHTTPTNFSFLHDAHQASSSSSFPGFFPSSPDTNSFPLSSSVFFRPERLRRFQYALAAYTDPEPSGTPSSGGRTVRDLQYSRYPDNGSNSGSHSMEYADWATPCCPTFLTNDDIATQKSATSLSSDMSRLPSLIPDQGSASPATVPDASPIQNRYQVFMSDGHKDGAIDPPMFHERSASSADASAISASETLFASPSHHSMPKREATTPQLEANASRGLTDNNSIRRPSAGARTARRPSNSKSDRFPCQMCHARFSLKKDALRHKAAKHDGKTYPCTISGCNAILSRKDGLKRHLDNTKLHLEARARGWCK